MTVVAVLALVLSGFAVALSVFVLRQVITYHQHAAEEFAQLAALANEATAACERAVGLIAVHVRDLEPPV